MWTWSVGKVARLAVVVGVLAAGLGFAGVSGAAGQTVEDVGVRDRLIADQEALLNVYRCMFDVDTEVVPGGCANGAPAQPAKGPSPFAGIPTAGDLAVRDQLVADQEALLNVYRCQFNIDTGLVPDGCPETAPEPETTPEAGTTVKPEATPEPETPESQCRVVYATTFNYPAEGETWDVVCGKLPLDTRHLCNTTSPGNRIYVTLELVVCGLLNCENPLNSFVGGNDDQTSWYSVCTVGWPDTSSPTLACPVGYVFVWGHDDWAAFGLAAFCASPTGDYWNQANWLEE